MPKNIRISNNLHGRGAGFRSETGCTDCKGCPQSKQSLLVHWLTTHLNSEASLSARFVPIMTRSKVSTRGSTRAQATKKVRTQG